MNILRKKRDLLTGDLLKKLYKVKPPTPLKAFFVITNYFVTISFLVFDILLLLSLNSTRYIPGVHC